MALMAIKISVTVFPLHLSGSGCVRTHFYDWNKTHFHPQEVYCCQYFLPLSPSSPTLKLLSAQIQKTFQMWRAVNCTTLHDLFLVLFCYLEESLNLLKGWKKGQVGNNSSEPAGSCPPFVSVPHFCKYLQKGKSGQIRETTTHWTKHRGSFSSTACFNSLIYQFLLTFYNTLNAMVKTNSIRK